MAEIWERQNNESSKAYAAFCVYRDLGPERSLDKALSVANKKPTNRRHWSRWMEKYRWYERAQAYDDYIERKERKEKEKAILEKADEMADRHVKLAKAFQQRIAQALQQIDPAQLSPSDMAKWLDVATKLERLSIGEPTEIGKQEVQGQVTQRYEYDITQRIEQYADVYRQLARRGVLCGSDEGDDTGEPLDTA
jgi:hypothetical protein